MAIRNGLALVACTLLLGACGEPALDHGKVIGKVYEPERNYTIFIPIVTGQTCYSTGGQYPSTNCTPIMTPFPFFIHDGADYKLKLQTEDRTGWAYVDAATYDRISVGTYFDSRKTPGAVAKDANNTRQRKYANGSRGAPEHT